MSAYQHTVFRLSNLNIMKNMLESALSVGKALIPVNFLTFDIEEWHDGEFTRNKVQTSNFNNSDLDHQVDLIIEICGQYECKATCFVTGHIAKNKPWLVKRLYDSGHEIASHSFSHKMISRMTSNEFREDLHKSVTTLSDLIGDNILGFRAPSWSVDKNCLPWFYDALGLAGIVYSSSIYPGKTSLFGIPDANPNIHFMAEHGVIEIPQQLVRIGNQSIGFAGGAFFRLFPRILIKKLVRMKNNMGNPVFIYIHPWELSKNDTRQVKVSVLEYLIMNWGISWNQEKLSNVIREFRNTFVTMGEYSQNIHQANGIG